MHSAPAIEAFNKAFLNEDTLLYDDIQDKSGASARGNLYPVYFGFASDETVKAAASLFKAPMERADEYYRLKVLSKCGLADEEYAQIIGGKLNAPEAEICAFIEDILSLNPDVISGSVWSHRLPADAGSLSARVQAFNHRALFTRHGDFVTLKF
ncbi:MAG: hypothetical protein II920_00030 [Clostridia bacterium]|nr:hypothetical protein [Clostridia bacterium]